MRQQYRGEPYFTAVLNSRNIPLMLEARKYWIETMYYNEKTTQLRKAGEFYVGVIATHRDREYLIAVPAEQSRATKAAKSARKVGASV